MGYVKLWVSLAITIPLLAFVVYDYDTLHLPSVPFNYASPVLPSHFLNPQTQNWDNTPADNILNDYGATLGRVLFYDVRLSANNTISCASCHKQEFAFTDTAQFSTGFLGGKTGRNSMSIVEVRYYKPGAFFWDHRASTLEAQTLMPIQHPVEMGMDIPSLIAKLDSVPFYDDLFTQAFGTSQVTPDRISKALSQFMRSILSYRSKYDEGMAMVSSMDLPFPNFTPEENLGKSIFIDGANQCRKCHLKSATPENPNYAFFMNDRPTNNGLDANLVNADNGFGDILNDSTKNGIFKTPTLRNIMVTGPYMHDGRLKTMDDVLNHYDTGIKPHPNLDNILRLANGNPRSIHFTPEQRSALKAFFSTLTDYPLQTDEKWSNPFCQVFVPTLVGNTSVCVGDVVTYSVTDGISGASYEWNIGGNYTIIAGCSSNDPSCTLRWTNGTTGTIQVTQIIH